MNPPRPTPRPVSRSSLVSGYLVLVVCLLAATLSSPGAASAAPAPGTAPDPVVRPAVDAVGSVGARSALTRAAMTPRARERRIRVLVNRTRSQARVCGTRRYSAVSKVRLNPRLARAATKHARAMATRDFFAHESLDGRDPGDRIREAGYRWTAYGENIAAGHTGPVEVMRAWIESPGHCAILMGGAYEDVGLGYVERPGSRYGRYWVLKFGAR